MGIVRGIVTLLLMLSFVGMTLWLFLGRNRFEAAARLPLEDDPVESPVCSGEQARSVDREFKQ